MLQKKGLQTNKINVRVMLYVSMYHAYIGYSYQIRSMITHKMQMKKKEEILIERKRKGNRKNEKQDWQIVN